MMNVGVLEPVSRVDESRARAATGVVLAVVAVAVLLAILSGLPNLIRPGAGDMRIETWVVRVDTRDADGDWAVYEWALTSGPRRAGELQTRKRECRRRSASHDCRATVEATFSDRDDAAEHRRIACQNYRQDFNQLPAGMTSC